MDSLTLRPWSAEDIDLLRAANVPAMTAHLNGPESDAEIEARSARYLRLGSSGEARMRVVVDEGGERVGTVGCWKVDWRGGPAWEAGWFVLPAAQGRGVASTSLGILIDDLRGNRDGRRHLVAFPSVDNRASNGVCRRSGFQLVGRLSEVFRGRTLEMNEWVLDMAAPGGSGL